MKLLFEGLLFVFSPVILICIWGVIMCLYGIITVAVPWFFGETYKVLKEYFKNKK